MGPEATVMCQLGNSSISRECRDKMIADAGRKLRNREMRALLDEAGGCAVHGKVDGHRKVMVEVKGIT